jgi:Histidine kinase-, DNA gyrase B-, and HSP90-like ATPase
VLERQVFKTSRLAEFCSVKELVAQTGHPVEQWPLVILKELVDNALDACEEAEIAPVIKIAVKMIPGAAAITVTDNGPGIGAETVEAMLDFSSRTSSNEAYVSPTRGAQGNALKTVVAMALALDGTAGETVIEAQGVRHLIKFTVNGITREPEIEHIQEVELVHSGTSVTVRWPNSACSQLVSAEERFVQIGEGYTWINPHLSLDIAWITAEPCPWFGGLVEEYQFKASELDWRKWKPSDPTSAHWYDVERLDRLAGAYVAMDQGRTVRDFIADFAGMARSDKQKAVLDATGLTRKPLSALYPDGKPDRAAFARLLTNLQNATKPVKAKDLGIIGEEHLADQCFACADDDDQLEAIEGSFKYKRILIDATVPAVIEVAFAYLNSEVTRTIITGVNWSAAINNPFRQIGYQTLDGVLQDLRVGPDEPVIVVIHLAYPRVTYTDRGKGALAVPSSIANGIVKGLTDVTADWTRQRKAEERRVRTSQSLG